MRSISASSVVLSARLNLRGMGVVFGGRASSLSMASTVSRVSAYVARASSSLQPVIEHISRMGSAIILLVKV
jgi:hypothetical protein